MNPPRISEAYTVQFPMVQHAVDIGWVAIDPKQAKAWRGGDAGKFFRPVLQNQLAVFNPWLEPNDISRIIDSLEALPATIEGNRQMLLWLRGECSWFDPNEKRQRPVLLVDFAQPAHNQWQVTWEWRSQSPARRKANRADMMFLVNGMPICIVEHKNPKDSQALERAVLQLRRYELETPELLASTQLFNVTHLLDYWYGVTWNINRRDMARWKQSTQDSYRFAVQAFFEPTDFLRTLKHWILFYVQDGQTRKSVLRQHQREAINAIVARCADSAKTRGLIWHTQGSGKTFTLLTAAKLILQDHARFAGATVLLVVDRNELEGQLNGWVERLIGEMQQQDIAVKQAQSKAELQALLDADFRGLIISMIHKFDAIRANSCPRDNVYVFIDEAHRSIACNLGTYLMAAIPQATLIGFTGTPIARSGQGSGTFTIFGAQDKAGYLHKYSIAESIGDETTLPIKHLMAPSDMTVPAERLDAEFFALAKSEGISDIEELNWVLDQAVGLRSFLAADDRIEKVAAFIAEHFKQNVQPLGYKAFVVAVNREACAKYKQALDNHLPAEWSAPIYSAHPADSQERPQVAQMQLSAQEEERTCALFKKLDKDPKILIVTDKLLTGFDAPPLYCLYLDKPMRDHVLLQTIARVNRPYMDAQGTPKPIGLVVDFVGVLRELKKALTFDSSDVNGVIEGLDALLQDFLQRMDEARQDYLANNALDDSRLEAVIYGRFLDEAERQRFFKQYKAIEALWEILSPNPALRESIDAYQNLSQLYASVRHAYAPSMGFVADLAAKTRRLIETSARQHGLGILTKTVTFDTATLAALPRTDNTKAAGHVFNLLRGLQQEIGSNTEAAPILQPIKARAERIVQDLQERKTSGLAAMDALAALAAEKEAALQAAKDSGLSPLAFAVAWELRDNAALKAADIEAMSLAKAVDALLLRFPHAAVNEEEQRLLRRGLYKPLLPLDNDDRAQLVERIMQWLMQEDRS